VRGIWTEIDHLNIYKPASSVLCETVFRLIPHTLDECILPVAKPPVPGWPGGPDSPVGPWSPGGPGRPLGPGSP